MNKTLAFVILLSLFSGLCLAGVRDSPLPRFSDNRQSKLAYTITGVSSQVGGLGTVFVCTNMDTSNINIGVQIFNYNGLVQNTIDSDNGAFTGVPPGRTIIFETNDNDIQGFIEDAVIITSPIAGGSARIVSTSFKILCSAILTDSVNAPPTSMVNLPIFKGSIQKGN